jgi:hypothetical protein
MLLSPGAYFVNNNSKAQRDSGFVRRNGVSLSVNGLTDISNKFYFDGIEGMNFDGGTRAFDPSLESVQEVKVMVNSNSAEYGGAAGATVNVVTKSGTNQFHGDAYDYLQNDKLNASVAAMICRPTSGRSVTICWSTVVLTDASSVLSSASRAVIVTVSLTSPTDNVRSTRAS